MNKKPLEIVVKGNKAYIYRKYSKTYLLKTIPLTKPVVRPIFKWAGGKQWLSPLAGALVPRAFSGTYFEPFIGGGALYFSIVPQKATISDLNADLINTYLLVKTDIKKLIKKLTEFKYNRADFYKIRASNPRTGLTKAARII